jgi:hypothetical protein
MPYEDIAAENQGVSDLASSGGEDMGMESGPAPGGPPSAPPIPSTEPLGQAAQPAGGLGGPGIDTPQEQQAMKAVMQGMMALRQAATADPSLRVVIDQHLQKMFLDITGHYGLAEEGKAALKSAQLMANRQRSGAVMGPPGPPGGRV